MTSKQSLDAPAGSVRLHGSGGGHVEAPLFRARFVSPAVSYDHHCSKRWVLGASSFRKGSWLIDAPSRRLVGEGRKPARVPFPDWSPRSFLRSSHAPPRDRRSSPVEGAARRRGGRT